MQSRDVTRPTLLGRVLGAGGLSGVARAATASARCPELAGFVLTYTTYATRGSAWWRRNLLVLNRTARAGLLGGYAWVRTMRRALARMLVNWVYAGLREGDASRALRMFAPGARLRFPGTSSWSVDTTDPAEIRSWVIQFAALRPNLRLLDVVVGGPPWRMSVCVVFKEAVRDSTGKIIYDNRGVQYMRQRWGRVVLDEVNLDTQRVAGLDELMPTALTAVPSRTGDR